MSNQTATLREANAEAAHVTSALGVLATAALADTVAVTLRQLHVIERLPDVRWRGFDANQVTVSPEAYPFGIPDGIPASALYLTELMLLALRRRSALRPRRRKWIDRLLVACVATGALGASYYAWQMITVEKKACVYCIGAIA
ncbi:MAG: vitamin K epoxide reductase family protein, partial [Polyangia bacterium]